MKDGSGSREVVNRLQEQERVFRGRLLDLLDGAVSSDSAIATRTTSHSSTRMRTLVRWSDSSLSVTTPRP